MRLCTSLVPSLLLLCACGVSGSKEIVPPTAKPAAPAAPATAPATAPAHGAAPAAAPASKEARSLVFEPPADWKVETPTSGMRKAQYKLPHVAGDSEDAECVVYFFGEMGGGGVDANVERWCSQFQQPDGSDSKSALVRNERKVGAMPVHEVELSGTYVAETAPGSGERVNKPGFRMLAAILESDHGAYYVKLVGPAATVEQQSTAFRDFIGRVR
jgi:hypothetical protein